MNITRFFIIVFVALLLAYNAAAQTVECPADKVCISREAALKALADADRVIALEKENKALTDALAGKSSLLDEMRVHFAEVSGENTALRQHAVRTDAIIDILLKNARPKKIGLIVF